MMRLFSDEDLWWATKQKEKILWTYIGICAFYVAVMVTLVVLFAELPYADPNQTWMEIVACVLTCAFIAFSFPYMGIKYARVKAYVKMLRFISVGLKSYTEAPFEGVDAWDSFDGVDVNVALFSVPGAKHGELMTRKIYIDAEKDYPPFKKGYIVKFVSQGNLLIEYELTEERGEICEQS